MPILSLDQDVGCQLPDTEFIISTTFNALCPQPHTPTPPTTEYNMSNISASELREKYTHFRILVIGRANAGKTTLLRRVCNTNEDPCIYDGKKKALRGIHDINRPFMFASNPQFIFHDSPGFEAGDESQFIKVQSFIEERARATDCNEQLHAIWFCLKLDKARFMLDLEKRFFAEDHFGNAPVIAILTKFDDLITQVYDIRLDYNKNCKNAETKRKELEASLFHCKSPPRAGIYVEDLHNDHGNHQEQVEVLIKKTAESLDDLSLKMLFVSIQQNNLELCIEYAVKYVPFLESEIKMWEVSCLSGGLR
ncbi:hypothetical protein DXG01_008861 [Tephrocybe rancida]|nr:hypothetical protein DXG01_008861 [Tephrocybe rancida]